jgi:hypothetical protein
MPELCHCKNAENLELNGNEEKSVFPSLCMRKFSGVGNLPPLMDSPSDPRQVTFKKSQNMTVKPLSFLEISINGGLTVFGVRDQFAPTHFVASAQKPWSVEQFTDVSQKSGKSKQIIFNNGGIGN